MPWVKARFKDKDIWAEVDAAGALAVAGGRVPIRYSRSEGAKIYRAGASGVRLSGDAPEELSGGRSADAPAGQGGARGGARRGSGFGSANTRTASQAAAAAASAAQVIAALPEGTHKAFTDGACKGNPGPCGAGAVVVLSDGRRLEASRALGKGTNNIGELTAVSMAIELLEEAGVAAREPVALFTDSKYSLGVLTAGWKAKANQALIGEIKGKLSRWPNLKVHWVAGHVGIPENERADALANAGVDESRRRR